MAFGLQKGTIDDIILLLAAILLFNTLPKLPTVGVYFERYPLILIGVALVLIIYRQRIANLIGG